MNSAELLRCAKENFNNIKKYEFYDNTLILEDNDGKKYVVKKNNGNIVSTYKYLLSRGFNYLPKLIKETDKYYIYEYVYDLNVPSEQKALDLINTISLLHNKTVYYKDISLDEVKETYEKLSYQIKNTYLYYEDIITMIENNVYYSPSYYLLARNISSFFNCLDFCENILQRWYDIMSKKLRKREVLLNNNVKIDHLIKNQDKYLIGWNKSSRGLPIYDFIDFYKKYYDKYDFNKIYDLYKTKFPLLEEEELLMYIILFIPDKITFSSNEMKSVVNATKVCNYLFCVNNLFMENKAKDTKKQDHQVNEQ